MAYDPNVDYVALLEPVAWPPAEGVAISARWQGRPVLAGTAWPVHLIGEFGPGEDLARAEIMEAWPHLSAAQVDTALAYFAANRALFERSRWQDKATVEELLEVARALARKVQEGATA